MSGRVSPAARLLAMLEDESALERLAAEEVQEDLAALGIDSSRAIAFARRLAASTGTPAGRLLGAIDAAEAADDEIDRIEEAEIGDVRRRVPNGTASAIVAQARRRAGGGTNVVGIRQRRPSRVLLWGGPLAGVAASLLVVFVLGRGYLESQLAETRHAAETAQRSEPTATENMLAEGQRFAVPEQRARRPGVGTPGGSLELAPQLTVDSEVDELAKSETLPASPQQSAEAEAPAEDVAGLVARPDSGTASSMGLADRDRLARSKAGEDTEIGVPSVTTMLVVEPTLAPPVLQGQSLPSGNLGERLDEARRLAGDRPVIALFTVRAGSVRQDFAQVALPPRMTQQLAAPSPVAELLGADAAQFDFIALPGP